MWGIRGSDIFTMELLVITDYERYKNSIQTHLDAFLFPYSNILYDEIGSRTAS